MPILKSAVKKLRQDKKRAKVNTLRKKTLKKLIKEALRSKSPAKIIRAISFTDRMAKVHLIHKNKASRLKSRLASIALTKRGNSSRLKS